MDLLEVQSVSKTYGSGETSVRALKNVSFSVQKGEYVAIVGESGSGKSTLLNMIGALDTPDSGKVWIDGRDIFAMEEKKLTVFRRRNIGFIFQAFNLIPELTVEQNMIFPVLLDYQKPDKGYLEGAAYSAEPEGKEKPSSWTAFRRTAAESCYWQGADHPPFADPCGRANWKPGPPKTAVR